jgi:Na+-translocating ferredoxin:NAD+ oxidoreductase subunit G
MNAIQEERKVPPPLLVGTLAGAGVIAGLLLAALFAWANPRIQEHAASELTKALNEVLAQPAHIEPLYVHANTIVESLPAGVDTTAAERVFAAYREDGSLIGFGGLAVGPGFAELIVIAFGYDPRTKQLTGIKVLENKETPGIADAILTDTFTHKFVQRETPLKGVKPERKTGDPHEVDMITGATVSSRAILAALNKRTAQLQPLLEAYLAGGGSQ